MLVLAIFRPASARIYQGYTVGGIHHLYVAQGKSHLRKLVTSDSEPAQHDPAVLGPLTRSDSSKQPGTDGFELVDQEGRFTSEGHMQNLLQVLASAAGTGRHKKIHFLPTGYRALIGRLQLLRLFDFHFAKQRLNLVEET